MTGLKLKVVENRRKRIVTYVGIKLGQVSNSRWLTKNRKKRYLHQDLNLGQVSNSRKLKKKFYLLCEDFNFGQVTSM